jgi:HlyD family secretion protein
MKSFIYLLLILGFGAAGYFLWSRWQLQEASLESRQRLTTTEVERLDINFSVSAAGEISPAEQVSVRPEINGKVATLPVDIGDRIKKGDTLFTLDDQELRNQRDVNRTEVDRANLQLDQAQRTWERSKRLFEGNLISVEEMDNFKTQYDLAKNTRDRSERDLAVVEERLTKTKIPAPFDCTVLARPISVGQAVSGSGGVSGGTEVLAIADLNKMIIQAHINQADVTRLQANQEVEVQVEAIPGLTVTGKVERIAPQATIRNNIKGFLSRILLQSVDPRVRPGMTANIKIPVETVQNVLAVPLSAVFTEYDQETGQMERYVYVKASGKYERRPVQVGLSDFFHAEVQSGLTEGEIVCLEQPPLELLPPGEKPTRGKPNGVNTANGRPGIRAPAEGPRPATKPRSPNS